MSKSDEPALTLGMEEEYLLVDRETMDLAAAPEALIEACAADLDGHAGHEFLQCQIEVGTGVCPTIADAREELGRLRATVARRAAEHGLAPVAAGCHPFGDWRTLEHTHTERYDLQERRLKGVARRTLASGMHVHVGVADGDLRVELMAQMAHFMPLLLALSASSPLWRGEDTGLASYRVAVFDNMPRTGVPPAFASWSAYERAAHRMTELGLIEDASKLYWDLRPSHAFPTLEARICDVCPRLEHALSLAALVQALARMLWRLGRRDLAWRRQEAFWVAENRWRAQRHGTAEGLIHFGREAIVPVPEILDELIGLLEEDADALGSAAEIEALRAMAEGTSADRQRAVLARAEHDGASRDDALRAVVAHLAEEFHADL